MIIKLMFLLIVLLTTNINSQEEFSFPMIFEDAVGNKDTIVVGYDSLATDSIDTAFGEVDIVNQPWDSTFEVRIGRTTTSESFDLPSSYQKKNIILKRNMFLIVV